MAQRATGFAKKPPTARGERVGQTTHASSESVQAAVPLKLAPLLGPYKKHGRLSLRVERMPQRSRLSAGRNNGNDSWSLTTDDLEDLYYFPPAGKYEPHTLAIRIIGIDGGGSTLAMIDQPVAPEAPAPAPAADPTSDAYLQQLSEELTKVKAALAAREAELEKRRQERTDTAGMRDIVDAEITSARAAWKLEMEQRLKAAATEAAKRLEVEKASWQDEHDKRVTESEERTQARIVEARERWRQEAKAALTQAQSGWRAEEASRFAEAEAQWRRKLAAATANAKDQPEGSQQKEIAHLRAQLSERDEAIAHSKSQSEQAKHRWRQDTDTALANAEATWRAGEAARLAAAQQSWKQQSDKELAELAARCQQAETSLARAEAAAKRPAASDDALIARLRKELAAAEADLAAKDTALAQARSDATIVGERDAIALKLLREELAVAHGKLAERETGHTQSTEAVEQAAAREAELKSVREELAKVRTALSARERDLATERSTLSARESELATERAKLSVRESELTTERNKPADTSDRDRLLKQLDETKAKLAARDAEHSADRAELAAKARDAETRATARETSFIAERERLNAQVREAESRSAAREASLAAERDKLSAQVRETESRSAAREASLAAERDNLATQIKDAESRAAAREAGIAAERDSLRAQVREAEARATAHEDGVANERANSRAQIDDIAAKLAEREAELALERSRPSGVQDNTERDALRVQLKEAEARVAERDARLASMHVSGNEAVDAAKLNYEIMLTEAKEAWKADEANRFTEMAARQRDANSVAASEAKSRAEAAEAALSQLRLRAGRDQSGEIAALQATIAERETELTYARSMLESNGLIRPGGDLKKLAGAGRKLPQWTGGLGGARVIFELSLVTVLAVAAFVYFPRAIALLPDSWQENIASATSSLQSSLGGTPEDSSTSSAKTASSAQAAPVAELTHSANLRIAPSGKAGVTATLARGTSVVTVEQSGSWTRVRVGDSKQQGWVYTAYLKAAAPEKPAPVQAPKPKSHKARTH